MAPSQGHLKKVAMMVQRKQGGVVQKLGWHASAGMLGKNQRGGKPVAEAFLKQLRVQWYGVPHPNTGKFNNPPRNYIIDIQKRLKRDVVRTYPTLAKLFGVDPQHLDLSTLLQTWKGPDQPGPRFGAVVDATSKPIDAVGFDIEEAPYTWKTRGSDIKLASTTDLGQRFMFSRQITLFRAYQIATVYRCLLASIQFKHHSCKHAFGYSAFQNDQFTSKADGKIRKTRAHYGCDWNVLFDPQLKWNNIVLPPLTHAMVGNGKKAEVGKEARRWAKVFPHPLYYNIQVRNSTSERQTRKILDGLSMIRPERGDGLAFVNFNKSGSANVWDAEDERILTLLMAQLQLFGLK